MDLPELLAGPVLRRSSTKSVTVWLATSRRQPDLLFQIYDWKSGKMISDPARQKTDELKVGQNLFVYLLRAKPKPGRSFPGGKFLSYDVGQGLLGFKNGIKPIWEMMPDAFSYGSFGKPTFVLQKKGDENLNTIYGSCRKMHGPGTDANRAADHLMKQHIGSVENRPNALLLCGDQIYADDVPGIMIRHIQKLARKLFGSDEFLPNLIPVDIPVDGRSEVLEKHTKFTSGLDANHLMTFGEFCATYLLAWNDELWPDALPTKEEMTEEMDLGALKVMKKQGKWFLNTLRVKDYRKGTVLLKRMMANVPTYMIFDDHEVTDDWNFNKKWERDNFRSAVGRRILANGIAAYWLFQSIGNSGRYFLDRRSSLKTAFLEQMENLRRGPHQDKAAGRAFEMAFLRFRKWSFITATQPRIIFADTRTQRGKSWTTDHLRYEFGEDEPERYKASFKSPLLINKKERRRIGKMMRSIMKRGDRLLIVTPAPVYGLSSIEKVKQYAERKKLLGATHLDLEGFVDDPHSFVNLFQQILELPKRPRLVVLLGGDVHYGFSLKSMIDTPSLGNSVMVAQFCSSGAKNFATPDQSLMLSAFKNRYEGPSVGFWGRSLLPNSHVKGPIKKIHGRVSAPYVSVGYEGSKAYFDQFNKQLKGMDFVFGEVFKFEKGNSSSLVETRNNMGFLQLKKGRLKHFLMVWENGLKKSLETNSPINMVSWPVYFRM